MHVDEKSNEITHAPQLLRQVDLRGVVVSGDAMFDQRELSIQNVQAKGDSHGMRQGQSRGIRCKMIRRMRRLCQLISSLCARVVGRQGRTITFIARR